MVSSQERRGLAVPLINLLLTARCLPPSRLHVVSFDRASGGTSRPVVFSALEGKVDGCSPGRINPPPSWAYLHAATPPRPAAPRRAAPRQPCRCAPPHPIPPVVCQGFVFDKSSDYSSMMMAAPTPYKPPQQRGTQVGADKPRLYPKLHCRTCIA